MLLEQRVQFGQSHVYVIYLLFFEQFVRCHILLIMELLWEQLVME